MALTLTLFRGKTMVAGAKWDVDDWNAALLPSATFEGGVGASDLADYSVTTAKLNVEVFNGMPAATALAVGDFLPFYDLSAAGNAKITVANALNGLFSLAPAGSAFTAYATDVLTWHNGTAAGTMPVARFAEQLIAQAPALATIDVADEVLVHDASAADGSQAARVTIANLLPTVGTSGTYTNVSGLTTDSKGRVTAVLTGTGAAFGGAFKTTGALPTLDGYANGTPVTVSPSFGQAAAIVTLDLECVSADLDYSVGDIVPAAKAVIQTNSHPAFTPVWTAADAMRVVRSNGTVLMYRKDGASAAGIDTTKWQFRLTAVKYS